VEDQRLKAEKQAAREWADNKSLQLNDLHKEHAVALDVNARLHEDIKLYENQLYNARDDRKHFIEQIDKLDLACGELKTVTIL